jgi:protease I
LAGAEASADDFDAVVIPGGNAPEELRVDVVKFVKELNHNSKVVAGICHGPQVMISANILVGKKSTCNMDIRDEVIDSGPEFINDEVVVNQNTIFTEEKHDFPL